jgi:integrase
VSHIEKCRNVWYATMKVPPDLQARIGKTKFKRSLQTPDKRTAQLRVAPVVAMWKAQLRQAEGQTNAVVEEAKRWRDAIAEAKAAGNEDQLDILPDLITDQAERLERSKGGRAAKTFADIALGVDHAFNEYYEEWRTAIAHLAPKTQDQSEKDVKRLLARFGTLNAVTAEAAGRWLEELQREGATVSSLKRMVSFWRSYWRYLAKKKLVKKGDFPFELDLSNIPRSQRGDSWRPFPAKDVPKLWRAALVSGDQALFNLIQLGAYSGCRIEELCSLKVKDVRDDAFSVVDAKTEAGIREVPLHPAIKGLVKALVDGSEDGYLLSGLTMNKYDDRSNAIGKRFGRMKTKLGFGRSHVFHSIRKTVVTLMENAGVSENIAADVVGHDKPRITYGLYSGGSELSVKSEALFKVAYPAEA